MEQSIEALLSVDAAGLSLDEQLDHLVEIEALLRRVSAPHAALPGRGRGPI
jgi:hypothetical protein